MPVFFLMMRKDNESLTKPGLWAGDLIDAYRALPDGKCPDIGRVPLMSSPLDGHPYGGMHSVIKVTDMDFDTDNPLQYLEGQDNRNVRTNKFTINPNFNSNARTKKQHIDVEGKMPAVRRNKCFLFLFFKNNP